METESFISLKSFSLIVPYKFFIFTIATFRLSLFIVLAAVA